MPVGSSFRHLDEALELCDEIENRRGEDVPTVQQFRMKDAHLRRQYEEEVERQAAQAAEDGQSAAEHEQSAAETTEESEEEIFEEASTCLSMSQFFHPR